MSNSHVIVWDLDGTLGDFKALHNQGDLTIPISVHVRPALHEALQILSSAGCRHTLLTLATPLYAEVVLRGTGLREFFCHVEGYGQRGKGDAVGIADLFGIPEADRPHRMLFVGDHPVNDAPRDPRVLFHLEVCGLKRTSLDLAHLVLCLRELGKGSFSEGFQRLGCQRSGWRRFWPGQVFPIGKPVERCFSNGTSVMLMRRSDDCPVIGFAHPPDPEVPPASFSFVPTEVGALQIPPTA